MSEEVTRLFRGNCFNKVSREYEIKTLEDRFPILKEELSKNLEMKKDFKR